MTRILVLGLGNPLMGDDGAGVIGLAELERLFDIPVDVERLDGGVLGLQLLGRVEGVGRLLVLDAVSAGQPPGTVMRLGVDQIRQVFSQKLSMHQMGFNEVLAAASMRGRRPPHLMVIGMQPLVIEPGLGLSPPASAAMPEFVDMAAQELTSWGVGLERRRQPVAFAGWETILSA
jgi:hydrogenase maturation protease